LIVVSENADVEDRVKIVAAITSIWVGRIEHLP
jgi:hypothetical protein